jgi:diguanylate cyclase
MAAASEAPTEPQAAYFASRRREFGLRFVGRVYPNRVIGLALGGIAVATVFWTKGAHPAAWLAIGVFALVWPHVAYGLGQSAGDPYAAEVRSLTIDSALGGAFIALMQFNLLPSVLIAVMLSLDKLTVGGLPFLARCTAALVGGCLLTALATGFDVRMETTMAQIYGSLPLLVVYPLIVGYTSYRMARQVRFQARQLETMSSTDGLSQMLTRQAWEKAVAEEFELCRRSGLTASLAVVDIDRMTDINETHGYPTGDEVIRSVAAILRDAVRSHDVTGRYGGGEFAVLMPGVDAERAADMLEGARRTISSATLEHSSLLRATVSIGVAQLDARHESYRDWIAASDQALQAGKAQAGNRTVRRDALDWTARPGSK